ncbi:MAG: hypothetical protein JSR39_00150 [Verrucomicrobia bacterium]|nr:hypothetical protein [Verrucomicrobiota bacterium]
MSVLSNNYNYSLTRNLPQHSEEASAATVIQRAFRRWKFTKEAANGTTPEQIGQLHLQMNSWSEQGFARYPRVPLVSRSITTGKCEEFISTNSEVISSASPIISSEAVSHVTFDAFKQKLGDVVDEFLQHVMSLPEGDRGYVLVVDEREKSNSWALSLCLDKLAAHPPLNVIFKEDLSKVYQNQKVKHVVFIDDASYSGSQLKGSIDECSLHFPMMPQLKGVHVLVPFLSAVAKEKILDSLQSEESLEGKVFFPNSIPIHAIQDLPEVSGGKIKHSDVSNFADQIDALYKGSDVHLAKDRVPKLHLIAFDHKVPDSLSVVTPLMESLVGKIVPPYKQEFDEVLDDHSKHLEAGLRVDLLPEIGPQLSQSVVLVSKEDKLYLATKTYLDEAVGITRGSGNLNVLPGEMIPIMPNDVVEVEGIGQFKFDGNKIVLI